MSTLEALQTTLAAEHAAVFVLGYLGAQTSASAEPGLYQTLQEGYTVHRTRRDEVVGLVRSAGGDPVAAAPSYELPDVSTSSDRVAAVRQRALAVERDCGSTYGFLVASTVGEQRRYAIEALLDAAVRELGYGGSPRRYPGR